MFAFALLALALLSPARPLAFAKLCVVARGDVCPVVVAKHTDELKKAAVVMLRGMSQANDSLTNLTVEVRRARVENNAVSYTHLRAHET